MKNDVYIIGTIAGIFLLVGVLTYYLITTSITSNVTTENNTIVNTRTKSIDYQSIKGYEFPEINRNAFKQSCIREAGQELSGISESYCSCLLSYIELNYSFNEFIKIEQEYIKTQKFPSDITAAISSCLE